MKTNLVNLLIILQCCVSWSDAQQFAYQLDQRLRQYIDDNNLFETYDFNSNYALGDPCISSATQKEGVCRPIGDCRWAVQKFLQTNELEDICRFSRRRGSIAVCCVRRKPGQNNFNQPLQPQFGPNNAPPNPVGVSEILQIEATTATTTTTTTTTASTTTTTMSAPVTVAASPTSNRKSFQKCEEYKKYAKKVIASIAAPPRPVRQANLPSFGGKFTIATEFPHMTAIGWTAEDGTVAWKCGGSLISVNFVMTAAHCCVDNSPDVVQISDKNLNSPIFFTENSNRIKIQEVINHPNYVVTASYNDISLVRLAVNVVLSSQIRPACLYQNEVVAETKFLISGWGNQEFGGSSSNELLKAEVDRVDQETCSAKYATDDQIPQGILKSQLCAGDKEGKADSCQGDSGGPLQIKLTNNLYYIVGITSFGKGCASKKTPGVYTRVSSFLDWIEMHVWP